MVVRGENIVRTWSFDQKPTAVLATVILLGVVFSSLNVNARKDAQDKQQALTTTELKRLLSGNSLAGNGRVNDPAEPYDWIAFYGRDGTLQIRLKPEWGGLISKGRWWLTDDGQQCRQFETGHKKEGCWRFYKEGKFLRFVPSSGTAVEGRAAVLPGNAL